MTDMDTHAQMFRKYVTIILLLSGFYKSKVNGQEAFRNGEYQLLNDVFEKGGYRSDSRPINDHRRTTNVTIDLMLHHILEVDTSGQRMMWMGWLDVEWHDEFLVWDSAEYGDVSEFHVPIERVWSPDILILNSVDDSVPTTQQLANTRVRVRKDGNVKWMTTSYFMTTCGISVQFFPMDTQKCHVRLGSRTMTEKQISIKPKFDVSDHESDYIRSGQWNIVHAPTRARAVVFREGMEKYSEVVFYFVLQRLPQYYIYNLLFPGLLVLIVGFFSFIVPPESGQKVGLSITALLSMMVFLYICMNSVPKTSREIPLLGQFIGTVVGMLGVSTTFAVTVEMTHFLGVRGRPVPGWMRRIMRSKLSTILCLQRATKLLATPERVDMMKKDQVKKDVNLKLDELPPSRPISMAGSKQRISQQSLPMHDRMDDLAHTNRLILQEMRSAREKAENLSTAENEWQVVGMFLDRIFLIIFVFLSTLICVIIFSRIDYDFTIDEEDALGSSTTPAPWAGNRPEVPPSYPQN